MLRDPILLIIIIILRPSNTSAVRQVLLWVSFLFKWVLINVGCNRVGVRVCKLLRSSASVRVVRVLQLTRAVGCDDSVGGCYWYIKVLIELLQWAVDALFLVEIQDREYSKALGCFELLLLMPSGATISGGVLKRGHFLFR